MDESKKFGEGVRKQHEAIKKLIAGSKTDALKKRIKAGWPWPEEHIPYKSKKDRENKRYEETDMSGAGGVGDANDPSRDR